LQSRWERLAGLASLGAIYDRLEDLNVSVGDLDDRIQSIRARGYPYGRGWEETAYDLQERWHEQYPITSRMVEQERRVLDISARDLNNLMNRAYRNPAIADTVENRLWDFERRINESQRRLEGTFDQTRDGVTTLQRELEAAEFVLDAFDGASFKLYPDESGFAAAPAYWLPRGTDEIEGMLFLTDGRVLFEKREEVATKKFLFITTEKKMEQELLWQGPVGAVEVLDVTDKKRFLGREELITLRFEQGDGPPEVTLRLEKADNEVWADYLRRAAEGQLEAERFTTPSLEEVHEEVAEAQVVAPDQPLPTKCPSCNAQLPTIYKGMRQVTCEYCGTVVPLPGM
jgi:hypothetical protein